MYAPGFNLLDLGAAGVGGKFGAEDLEAGGADLAAGDRRAGGSGPDDSEAAGTDGAGERGAG